jgi:hypothetical protein
MPPHIPTPRQRTVSSSMLRCNRTLLQFLTQDCECVVEAMRRRSSCGSYLLVQSFVRVTAHRRMMGTKSIDAVQQLQFPTHLLEALHGLRLLCSSCRRSRYGWIGLRFVRVDEARRFESRLRQSSRLVGARCRRVGFSRGGSRFRRLGQFGGDTGCCCSACGGGGSRHPAHRLECDFPWALRP